MLTASSPAISTMCLPDLRFFHGAGWYQAALLIITGAAALGAGRKQTDTHSRDGEVIGMLSGEWVREDCFASSSASPWRQGSCLCQASMTLVLPDLYRGEMSPFLKRRLHRLPPFPSSSIQQGIHTVHHLLPKPPRHHRRVLYFLPGLKPHDIFGHSHRSTSADTTALVGCFS